MPGIKARNMGVHRVCCIVWVGAGVHSYYTRKEFKSMAFCLCLGRLGIVIGDRGWLRCNSTGHIAEKVISVLWKAET